MSESPLARPDILEAILVLRGAGITPEQYRDLDLTEHWSVGSLGDEFPDRASAFAAAQTRAVDSGEDAEVWRSFGVGNDGAELWIVKPDGTTWLPSADYRPSEER